LKNKTTIYSCFWQERGKKTKTLHHLSKFLKCQKFGDSLGLSSPAIFSWFPSSPDVCPSTLANYLCSQGVQVVEVASELDIVRVNPVDGKIPGFEFIDEEDFDLEEFENWIGASFLQTEK
jgi:hypothetical protein